MNKNGPIIIIEDDLDDQEILGNVFIELNYDNEIVFFADATKALDYLTNTEVEPFIIFSDINMPKLSGLELRAKVHENEDLRLKSIPYLFFHQCRTATCGRRLFKIGAGLFYQTYRIQRN